MKTDKRTESKQVLKVIVPDGDEPVLCPAGISAKKNIYYYYYYYFYSASSLIIWWWECAVDLQANTKAGAKLSDS